MIRRFHLAALLLLVASCTREQADWHSQFDAQKAWGHVRAQVDLGPRPAGSAELGQAADLIEKELQKDGLLTVRHRFTVADTPRGPVDFCNVIGTTGSWPPEREIIVIATHYDTKWMPDIRFVGANDGASSTGCLLEVARVLSKVRGDRDFVFIFFDGEECFRDYGERDGLYGSRRLAADLAEAGILDQIRAMVVLDMVGDAELNVTIPDGDPALTKAVFDAAESLGLRGHFSLLGMPLTDDHEPFAQRGVSCIDLIDFKYGPGHSYWHTEKDSLENVSARSLEIVGRTVLKMLEDLDANQPGPSAATTDRP